MCLTAVDFRNAPGRFLRQLIDRALKLGWPGKRCLLFEIGFEDPRPAALVEISGAVRVDKPTYPQHN